jgi:hypothetical protein
MILVKKNIRPRDIATKSAFFERHRPVDMALGCSPTPCSTCRPGPEAGID